MGEYDTEELDGLAAANLRECFAEEGRTITFDGVRCGRCGEEFTRSVEILVDADGAFVALKSEKVHMLNRRHNGLEQYFTFWCKDCTEKEDFDREYHTTRVIHCKKCSRESEVSIGLYFNEAGKLTDVELEKDTLEKGWAYMLFGDAGGEAPYCAECLKKEKDDE